MKSNDERTLSQGDLESQISIKIVPKKKPKLPKNENQSKNFLNGDFIAPDGGWGWMVVIAAAISMLVTCDLFQQFYVLLKERSKSVGVSTLQVNEVVLGLCWPVTFTYLFSGELFRRFTFRQICMTGALLSFIGLTASVFSNDVHFDVLTITVMYGIGRSLIWLSSLITIFTYFKEKRLTAIALMFSISSLGALLIPRLSNFLRPEYGTTWTMLFYAILTLHNFVSAFIFQPVELHVEEPNDIEMDQVRPLNLMFGSLQIRKLNALEAKTDSNDDLSSQRSFPSQVAYPLRVPKNSCASFAPLTRPVIPKIILPDETEYFESIQEDEFEAPATSQKPKNTTFLQKIKTFFDFDLLQNCSYVNMALGLTVIHFVETNFAILVPQILSEFGYDDETQVFHAMSIFELCDLITKIVTPVLVKCFSRNNKAVFLCAVLGTCIGRAVLVFGNNFVVVLVCFGWLGICKAVRTIFGILIIPSYLTLERLPAAIGLQQVISGVFSLVFTSYAGSTLSASNYSFSLNCMNGICFIVAMLWLGENLLKLNKKMKLQREI